MQLTNNIDLIQINIRSGVSEYFLPKNVIWRNKTIDKLLLVVDTNPLLGAPRVYSPIDGVTPVLRSVSDLYFDLYSNKDEHIVRDSLYTNFLYLNNNVEPIHSVLSLNLSRLYFTVPPTEDGCLLLYVYYGSKEAGDTYEEPTQSITVSVPMEGGEKVSLQYIVDNYIYMQPNKVKGVIVWDSQTNPVFLSLRDKEGKCTLNNVISSLCRPPQGLSQLKINDSEMEHSPLTPIP